MTKPQTFAETVAAMAQTLSAQAGVSIEVTHRGGDQWTASFEGTAAHPAKALVEVLTKIGRNVSVEADEEIEMTCVFFEA